MVQLFCEKEERTVPSTSSQLQNKLINAKETKSLKKDFYADLCVTMTALIAPVYTFAFVTSFWSFVFHLMQKEELSGRGWGRLVNLPLNCGLCNPGTDMWMKTKWDETRQKVKSCIFIWFLMQSRLCQVCYIPIPSTMTVMILTDTTVPLSQRLMSCDAPWQLGNEWGNQNVIQSNQ